VPGFQEKTQIVQIRIKFRSLNVRNGCTIIKTVSRNKLAAPLKILKMIAFGHFESHKSPAAK